MMTEITPELFEGQYATITKIEMLTQDVLEMQVETKSPTSIQAGQYAMLGFKDQEGDFIRAYSIVHSTQNTLVFRIKLKENGRAGTLLKTLKIGDMIRINKILGNFILRHTPNPKVFIATGTGIAPLYNMIINNSYSEDMYLFWGVRTKSDLFYIEKFNSISNLTTKFFLSREENSTPYAAGRVNVDGYNFVPETEFYLCGNAPMVKEQVALLKAKGYQNIYLEIF